MNCPGKKNIQFCRFTGTSKNNNNNRGKAKKGEKRKNGQRERIKKTVKMKRS